MSSNTIINNFENINAFDFNLLFVFETIFIYSSVSIAADKLDSSPSSVSQSLNKLRAYFSDPLFVRKGQGLVPTTVAILLHERIGDDLGGLVNSLVNFTESDTRNKFIVYCSPYTAQRILPDICSVIHQNNLPYELVHISADASLDASEDVLTYRKADVIFDTKPQYGNATVTMEYMRENVLAVCEKSHPRLNDKLTTEDLGRESFTFLNINTQGLKRFQDMIEEVKSNRHKFFTSSSVEVNAAVTEVTECVSFVTETFFAKFGECYNLKALECSFELPPMIFYMTYNKSAMQNSNFSQFIEVIKKIKNLGS
ncbi:LysR family transcriptional regulator [Ewingella americana]|uniref:LysR family transcriptional regulator n=1 Tax=Ewingella americana TaxID=41202 RepID=A0A502GCV3_9GAMM|nr:LysR family transcriptional regulator [Ewingella americana]TPG58866.1 LysR family transcriptional regulator [Ewingella americana]